jgi:hypothetical protein
MCVYCLAFGVLEGFWYVDMSYGTYYDAGRIGLGFGIIVEI